jgi:3-oxoacyl-[acyl-carrier-protein] synthase II
MEVYITGRSLVTCAGVGVQENWQRLFGYETFFSEQQGNLVGKLAPHTESHLIATRKSSKYLHQQDEASIVAVMCGGMALDDADIREEKGEAETSSKFRDMGVVIGSSRGPWDKLESSIRSYAAEGKVFPHTSPVTTSNALSAAVARQYGCSRLALSVSATCASGLEAIGLGFLTVKSGFTPKMLVGGVDTAISPFMVSMLKTAKVYANETEAPYLVRPSHAARTGLILSQAGAMLTLETGDAKDRAVAVIRGFGARTEQVGLTGVGAEGTVLADAIGDALRQSHLSADDIDIVIAHGSGRKVTQLKTPL